MGRIILNFSSVSCYLCTGVAVLKVHMYICMYLYFSYSLLSSILRQGEGGREALSKR